MGCARLASLSPYGIRAVYGIHNTELAHEYRISATDREGLQSLYVVRVPRTQGSHEPRDPTMKAWVETLV